MAQEMKWARPTLTIEGTSGANRASSACLPFHLLSRLTLPQSELRLPLRKGCRYKSQLLAVSPTLPPEPALRLENQPVGFDIYSLVMPLYFHCHESRNSGSLPHDKYDGCFKSPPPPLSFLIECLSVWFIGKACSKALCLRQCLELGWYLKELGRSLVHCALGY